MTSQVDVSIVIPVVNGLQYTKQCLESIFRHGSSHRTFEVVVIDNATDDGTAAYLESLHDSVRTIRNDAIRPFAASCNQGAEQARGTHLLFLNNDTIVTEGWLAPMVDLVEEDDRIGIVANRHLFPVTELTHHVGMVFKTDKLPTHLYPHHSKDLPFLNETREFSIVTGACMLISKALFEELGGFYEGYRNGFEDVELCLQARDRGYRVMYCAESTIYHYGQASPKRTENDAYNEELFLQRWGDKIDPDIEDYYEKDNYPAVMRRYPIQRLKARLARLKGSIVEYLRGE